MLSRARTLSHVTMPCTLRRWSHLRTRSVRGVSGGGGGSVRLRKPLGHLPCTTFRHRGHGSSLAACPTSDTEQW